MTEQATGPVTEPATGPATDAALRVEELTVRYAPRGSARPAGPVAPAVEQVSFTIEPGQCLGLVGESGSGKSTIGSAVQGLLARTPGVVTEGSIVVAGTRLDPSDERQCRAVRGDLVTTVFQDPMSSLDPTMTIGRMLRLVTGSREESLRWLEEVEIRHPAAVLKSYPHQLSGGMRQRVMIAMALARRPAVLVADEPTTALDVSVQAQVLRLLDRERLGLALLFITHDLGVAGAICDDVAVMRHGRIVEQGAAAGVLGEPTHDYTRRLVASRLTLETDRSRPTGLPEPTVVAAMSEATGRSPEVLTRDWESGDLGWDGFGRHLPAPGRVPALELALVTKSFTSGGFGRKRRTSVLHGVDLRVAQQESVALLGESGSGKSTILRIAAGLERPDSGDVVVDSRRGEGVQVIFQDAGASLTPWLTVRSLLLERLANTATGRALGSTEREDRVRLALERVALPEAVLDAKAGQLSGGQRQRVAIARAVVVPPALLLCDEPTSALDVSVACTVLNLLNLLRHDLGLSMLFVTHDVAAARVVADRIDVISEGRIVEQRPAAELQAVTSDYGRKLLDAVLA